VKTLIAIGGHFMMHLDFHHVLPVFDGLQRDGMLRHWCLPVRSSGGQIRCNSQTLSRFAGFECKRDQLADPAGELFGMVSSLALRARRVALGG
jgi:hypothetical protein